MYLKQLNDISKAVDSIESKITEIQGEIEGIEKVSVHLHACCVSLVQWNLDYLDLVYPAPRLFGHAQLH